jgi:hypothetical protein
MVRGFGNLIRRPQPAPVPEPEPDAVPVSDGAMIFVMYSKWLGDALLYPQFVPVQDPAFVPPVLPDHAVPRLVDYAALHGHPVLPVGLPYQGPVPDFALPQPDHAVRPFDEPIREYAHRPLDPNPIPVPDYAARLEPLPLPDHAIMPVPPPLPPHLVQRDHALREMAPRPDEVISHTAIKNCCLHTS